MTICARLVKIHVKYAVKSHLGVEKMCRSVRGGGRAASCKVRAVGGENMTTQSPQRPRCILSRGTGSCSLCWCVCVLVCVCVCVCVLVCCFGTQAINRTECQTFFRRNPLLTGRGRNQKHTQSPQSRHSSATTATALQSHST